MEVSSEPTITPPDNDRDLRILLWGIDGTLMRSAPNTFRESTKAVLRHVFGTAGRIDKVPLTGMTDLQYIVEALSSAGFTREDVSSFTHEISNQYLCEIQRAIRNGAQFNVLPGVREALETIAKARRYRSAILTGSFQSTANFKLNLADLSDYFDVPGTFGDQAYHRRELPPLAARIISTHLRSEFAPSQFIVIGDTPDDIAGARHFGARSIGVATGHSYTFDDLLRCEPDAVLPDLSNTQLLMQTLARL
ncbi:MAG TPA: HAD family hydrolase [Pyrinomonadaceae bacterium]|jgi:phosphoglycolate phosphatase-like HAD superfamily hydrolase|nr:HAD family hydrolase [Pyrinomonadaceae bacterium]